MKKNNFKVSNKKVVELIGTDKLEAIVIEDVNTLEKQVLNTDGVFVAIGHMANNEPFKNICDLDEKETMYQGRYINHEDYNKRTRK